MTLCKLGLSPQYQLEPQVEPSCGTKFRQIQEYVNFKNLSKNDETLIDQKNL